MTTIAKILPEQVLNCMTFRERETYEEFLAEDIEPEKLNQLYDYYMNYYRLYTKAYNEQRLDSQYTVQSLLESIDTSIKTLSEMERNNSKIIFDKRSLPMGNYVMTFGPFENPSSYVDDPHPFLISEKIRNHVDTLLDNYERGYDLHYSTFYDINKCLIETINYWCFYQNLPRDE